MSSPQPPADDPSRPEQDGSRTDDASGTYEFHGEKLDFDPYRFGAPESPPPHWTPTPTAPATGSGHPPAPGERWTPGADQDSAQPRPGDYWNAPPADGAVFPPPGYTPPPGYPPAPAGNAAGDPAGRVDLGKAPSAPPSGAYPPPYPRHPTGYPAPPGQGGPTASGNGLAVAGLVVGIVGLLLAVTSWPGILVGLVGLGLSIAGLVHARRGAPRKTMAVWGLACSVLAVVLGTIVLVVVLSRVDFDCVVRAGGDTSQAQDCIR